ncbi:hypothetical protein NSE_0491 [Neorickettsia sennetsu str. Miyayama]|uniref:Uncharacterized protein n=1 Tax=Ehrlichia sennetsu (strain ATCC VR-367 / Miyayama) TaxID=222891 RepID=Q2GDS1_EHRS3|nr:hypothetical protein NSE_0491 [Neorickettsia sennetsu str. Miyayama]
MVQNYQTNNVAIETASLKHVVGELVAIFFEYKKLAGRSSIANG